MSENPARERVIIPTHIEQLDQLLRGGFVLPPGTHDQRGLVVLIRGKGGTGKSTLALQIAANISTRTMLQQACLLEQRLLAEVSSSLEKIDIQTVDSLNDIAEIKDLRAILQNAEDVFIKLQKAAELYLKALDMMLEQDACRASLIGSVESLNGGNSDFEGLFQNNFTDSESNICQRVYEKLETEIQECLKDEENISVEAIAELSKTLQNGEEIENHDDLQPSHNLFFEAFTAAIHSSKCCTSLKTKIEDLKDELEKDIGALKMLSDETIQKINRTDSQQVSESKTPDIAGALIKTLNNRYDSLKFTELPKWLNNDQQRLCDIIALEFISALIDITDSGIITKEKQELLMELYKKLHLAVKAQEKVTQLTIDPNLLIGRCSNELKSRMDKVRVKPGRFLSLEQQSDELSQKVASMHASQVVRNLRLIKRLRLKPQIGEQIDWDKAGDSDEFLTWVYAMALESKEKVVGANNPWAKSIMDQSAVKNQKSVNEGISEDDTDIPEDNVALPTRDMVMDFNRADVERQEILEVANKLISMGLPLDFERSQKHDGESSYLNDSNLLGVALDMISDLSDGGDKSIPRDEVLVVDGLNVLATTEQQMLNLRQLVELLRKRARIAIIVYEPPEEHEDYLDYQVDLVLEMRGRELSSPVDYFVRDLCIQKARYQDSALGWHQYKIRSWGIEIYESTHFQVHIHDRMNNQLLNSMQDIHDIRKKHGTNHQNSRVIKPKKQSIIESVLGFDEEVEMEPGSCTVLLGSRGTFKTTLSLDFLVSGVTGEKDDSEDVPKDPRRGLLVSLMDHRDTIGQNARCPRTDENKHCALCTNSMERNEGDNLCMRHIFLFHQRPGCVTPCEFMHFLQNRITLAKAREFEINRLAFWDLTQIDCRYPLMAADPMFLPALMNLFKKNKVSSIFIGAANAGYAKQVSAIADNVIFCWRDWLNNEDKDKRKLMLYVDRGQRDLGKGGKSLHALSISEKGILAPWKEGEEATNMNIKSMIKHISLDQIHCPQAEDPSYLYAEKQIERITSLQGLVDAR